MIQDVYVGVHLKIFADNGNSKLMLKSRKFLCLVMVDYLKIIHPALLNLGGFIV
jgi:hypothetical protein